MSSARAFSLSLPLLLALGCSSSEPSTNEHETSAGGGRGDSTNAVTASNTTNSLPPVTTAPSGSTTSGDNGAATTGTGGAGSSTNGGPTTNAGGSGGSDGGVSSSNSGGAATTGTASGGAAGGTASSTASSSTTGDTVVDPDCGSHKWACWPMPNQVGSGLPNEASYTKNDDQTVIDNITLLMWDDRVTLADYTWEEAITACKELELAGFSDWRLPTRIEITSVLDHSDDHTGWAAEAFGAGDSGFHFSASDWILTITQTGAGAGNDYAWAFNMSDGIVSNAYSKSNRTPLKCVRGGGSGEGPSDPAVAPPDQYSVVGDGEVQDNYTGLIWQQGGSDEMLSWQESVDYCNYLTLGGNAWRLPSIRELATLVDEAQVAPAINREMFPDTKYGARSNNWYWATPERGSAAWGLNFDDGFTGTNTGSAAWNTFGPAWARCVR